MKKMKKSILAATLLLSAVVIQPAHAIVGAVILNAPMVVAGLALSLYPITCRFIDCGSGSNPGVEAALGGAGLVLLDGSSGRELVFSAVSADDAQKLDLSANEMTAYNGSLEELNLISRAVDADLAKIAKPSPQDSKAAWDKYSAELSPDAYLGAQKVALGAEHINQ